MSKKCSNCGAELDDISVFCDNCGTRQENNVNRVKTELEQKKRKWILPVAIAIIILAVVGVFVGSNGTKANEVDFVNYVNGNIQTLLKDSNLIREVDKEMQLYGDESGYVSVMPDEEMGFYYVKITEGADSRSKFAGIQIGQSLTEKDTTQLEEHGYKHMTSEDGIYATYGNEENQSVVMFEMDGRGKIISISWIADMYEEQLAEMEASEIEEETEIKESDYEYIYGGIVDSVLSDYSDYDYLYYTFYDVNKDGYLEFIVQHGTCSADIIFEVYSTNGNVAMKLGEIYGDLALYEYPDGNGFYTEYCQMDYQLINRVYEQDGVLVEEKVYEGGGTAGYKEDLEMQKYPIEMYSFDEESDAGNNLSYDLTTDVSNEALYSNENGQITDKAGNVIDAYSYIEVLDNGSLADLSDETIIEGYFVGGGGKIVYSPPAGY